MAGRPSASRPRGASVRPGAAHYGRSAISAHRKVPEKKIIPVNFSLNLRFEQVFCEDENGAEKQRGPTIARRAAPRITRQSPGLRARALPPPFFA